MCGIFGAISVRGLFDSQALRQFADLTNLVWYRGPDDSGFTALNIKEPSVDQNEYFDVFLGNRRLSILDLSTSGHQPMTDGAGRWITYNGEIFNFLELRKELEALGHRFKTGTDTEVILHIYGEYGEAGFAKLNGMWAFLIADVPGRRVVISRDRFSIKPLYCLRLADEIYFGSEIKQLLPFLPKRELNREIMGQFLAQGLYDHSPETFFVRIERVAAKTTVIISLGTGLIKSQQYWDYEGQSKPCSRAPVDEFRELLLDSTKIRLRSDVPVGLLLSGGLDSSSLAAAIVSVGESRLDTYSIVSDGPCTEERYIDAVSHGLRLANHKIHFRLSDVRAILERTIFHNDEPVGGLSVIAQFKIFEEIKARKNVTVLLSGQGGDEILLGYLKFYFFYLRDLTKNHRYRTAIAEFLLSLVRGTAVRQFRLGEAKRYVGRMAVKRPKFLRESSRGIPVWETGDLRQRQVSDIDRYSVPALTHYEDRNGCAHSLEIRHPFLDHRLVDFALNLPIDQKLRGGWSKRILRESFPELPNSIRWRKDKGYFSVPEEAWLKSGLSAFIRETFRNSVLDEMGVMDAGTFLKTYDAFQNGGKEINAREISRALIAEVWAQKYFGQTRSQVAIANGSERRLVRAGSPNL